MKNKIVFALLLLIFIISISHVSAEETNNTDINVENYDYNDLNQIEENYDDSEDWDLHDNTKIDASVAKTKYPAQINIKLFDLDDGEAIDDEPLKITVFDNNVSQFTTNMKTDNNGKIYFYMPTKPGSYSVLIKYSGDDFFNPSECRINVNVTDSNVPVLKSNKVIDVGKYSIKLSKKQYDSLIKSFKNGKFKSLTIKTKYLTKVKIPQYKTVKKYKTLKLVTTYYSYYKQEFKKMKKNGWVLKSEKKFTKKNPSYKDGLGLSAYEYSVSKWVKKVKKLSSYKSKKCNVYASINVNSLQNNKVPSIMLYTKEGWKYYGLDGSIKSCDIIIQ